MGPLVNAQPADSGVLFPAGGADVGLLPGVCQVVALEVTLGDEGLAADLADKWPFPSLIKRSSLGDKRGCGGAF